jgi:hypothetical protein
MIRAKQSVILEITKDDYKKITDFEYWMNDIKIFLNEYPISYAQLCVEDICTNISNLKTYMEVIE